MKRYKLLIAIILLSVLCASLLIACNTPITIPGAENQSGSCNVVFDANGGMFYDGSTTFSEFNLSKDTTLSQPTSPTRNGYTFAGWSISKNTNEYWNFASDKLKNDLTLYAIWKLERVEVVDSDSVSKTFYGELKVEDNYGKYNANGAGYIANFEYLQVDISNLNLDEIKSLNQNIALTIELSIREKYDGYQEIFVYNSNVDKNDVQIGAIVPIAKGEVEHGVGKTNRTYARYKLSAVISPDAITSNVLWIAFDAYGISEDTWYAKDINVRLTKTSDLIRQMQTTKVS